MLLYVEEVYFVQYVPIPLAILDAFLPLPSLARVYNGSLVRLVMYVGRIYCQSGAELCFPGYVDEFQD
jgi:hypothetical protein